MLNKSPLLERMLTLIAGYIIAMFALRMLLRLTIFGMFGLASWDIYTGRYENSTPVYLVLSFVILAGLWGAIKGR